MELSELLKKARIKAGLKQYEAADKIGISSPTLCNIEKGIIEPKISTLKKFCKVYEIHFIDVILGTLTSKELKLSSQSIHANISRIRPLVAEISQILEK